MSDAIVIAYCDGSSVLNTKTGRYEGGIGVHFPYTEHRDLSMYYDSKHPKGATNNRCELAAILLTLNSVSPAEKLNLYSDSNIYVRLINRNLPEEELKKRKNPDLLIAISRKIAERTAPFWLEHVKGHSGIPGNEEADRLANLGRLRGLPQKRRAEDQKVPGESRQFPGATL